MKKAILIFCLSFFTFYYSPAQGVWTWMSGPSSLNAAGVYGTQGIPSVNNYPPCAYSSFSWTDLQGNFWVFGGSNSSVGYFGDMWKFNPVTLEWTWVQGNGTASPSPVYGTIGVASPTNTPGGRYWSSCAWVDTNGDLWLYGGYGKGGVYADLWKYNIASNEWTWMAGPNTTGQSAEYGTMGVPSPTNNPGNLCEIGNPWVDANGQFWLYGGSAAAGHSSAMWMYNPATGMWTWESGPQTLNNLPSYGSKRIFSANNTPGGRRAFCMMTESNGNFLLFGGSNGTYTTIYADFWEYNPGINQWAWIGGSQNLNTPAVAGAACQSDSGYYPDSRFENKAIWKDCAGNMWTFGGCVGQGESAGDVWVYQVATKEWARMSNASYINTNPVYGSLGVPAVSNQPGSRSGPAHWQDNKGNFWICGGFNNSLQTFADVWRYSPDTVCVKVSCGCNVYAGVLSANPDSFCVGSASTLSVSNSVGKLQWISSMDGIHYSAIVGATSSIYTTPSSLTQTTYYRAVAGGAGCSDTTVAKTVNILPQPVAGAITRGRDSICAGSGITSHLTSGGSTGNLQWQSSTDGINFSNILNANSTAYTTPPSLTQTTIYRLVATNSCGSDTSNAITVHVVPAPVAIYNYTINGKQVSFNSDSSYANLVRYNWDFGDNQTSDSPNPTHLFDSLKIYYVCLTVYNNSNCSFTLCDYVNLEDAGIKNISGNNIINLYPNPSNNTINLSVDGLSGTYELKIYNVLGQTVGAIHELPLSNNQIVPIDISNLAPGTYELMLSNNLQYYSKRFVHVK